jgi:hypothetical protein
MNVGRLAGGGCREPPHNCCPLPSPLLTFPYFFSIPQSSFSCLLRDRDVNEQKSNDTIWGKKVKNRKIEKG